MTTSLNPLLPAFHILWNAATSEFRKTVGLGNQPANNNPNLDLNKNDNHPNCVRNYEAKNMEWCPNSEETVVVCTIECDQGDSFSRQIIHEGSKRTEWSRSEDLFVDWLGSQLNCQHALKVEVNIYLCCVPMDTTSHGIGLWLNNIRTEGKEVIVKLKIAALGDVVQKALAAKGEHQGKFLADDRIRALRKLCQNNVQVEPILSADWVHLMKLLTDRSSIDALDRFHHRTVESITHLLHTPSNSHT
ncbi:uncharacterized protein LOC131932011 [Physella acuta]|uniref:uncharacterized protein LOC131932011 n=1 Tax=Physella acuta TaxID=109671 RepID=UPI0027DD7B42|nr:uncharacterized protein LOC131932011 [Physella acuta]